MPKLNQVPGAGGGGEPWFAQRLQQELWKVMLARKSARGCRITSLAWNLARLQRV